MKKKWKKPEILVQKFVPNEYVSACGILGDGTVLYSANIRKEIAYQREPAGLKNYVQDDTIFDPHQIYMGAFYRDKELTQPDSTQIIPDSIFDLQFNVKFTHLHTFGLQ